MFTERVSSNVIAVVDFNGGLLGYIVKGPGAFFVRMPRDTKTTRYATEAQAAAHFGF